MQQAPTTSAAVPSGLEAWRGRVVIVTGAASGVGWALSLELAKAGGCRPAQRPRLMAVGPGCLLRSAACCIRCGAEPHGTGAGASGVHAASGAALSYLLLRMYWGTREYQDCHRLPLPLPHPFSAPRLQARAWWLCPAARVRWRRCRPRRCANVLFLFLPQLRSPPLHCIPCVGQCSGLVAALASAGMLLAPANGCPCPLRRWARAYLSPSSCRSCATSPR